jgi:ABC-2 type transport system permease protein
MDPRLAPHRIRTVSKFNPVNWAAEAGRSATLEKIDWGLVAGRVGLLAALVFLAAVFATRAFGAYQRSL